MRLSLSFPPSTISKPRLHLGKENCHNQWSKGGRFPHFPILLDESTASTIRLLSVMTKVSKPIQPGKVCWGLIHTITPENRKKNATKNTHPDPFRTLEQHLITTYWGCDQKSKQDHVAVGAPLLIQLLESGEEERKVCLSELLIARKKIIKKPM